MAGGGIPFASLVTPSSTRSPSATPEITRTPSFSPTQTASLSASRSQTRSATTSRSQTRSATTSRSQTSSRSRTPTATASQPLCRSPVNNVTILRGTSGSVFTKNANAGMYTSGSCSSGYRSFFPGSRLVYALFLGASTPLGGTLTVTTCGRTDNNTVLYIGTGCPTWSVSFNCLAGSDNDASCSANPLASRIVLQGITQTNFYIQLGGFSGASIVSGLAWSYVPPSATRKPSPSKSRKPKL